MSEQENQRRALDSLTAQLQRSQAQIRRIKRDIHTKCSFLDSSRDVLCYELAHAFSDDDFTLPRRRRLLPKGVVPLFPLTTAPVEKPATATKPIDQATLAIKSCVGWFRNDRVWIRVQACNISNFDAISQAHLYLSCPFMPNTFDRNNVFNITNDAVLYAAFTLPVTVFPDDVKDTLWVSCRSLPSDSHKLELWHTTGAVRVQWHNQDDCTWLDPYMTYLPIYYPCNLSLLLASPDLSCLRLSRINDSAQDTSAMVSQDHTLLAIQSPSSSNRVHLFALSNRQLAQASKTLDKTANILNSSPYADAQVSLKDVVVAWMDEVDQLGESKRTPSDALLAARENSVLKLSSMLRNGDIS